MLIKQLSIFVENKPGRLCAVTGILKENNIDIKALSIADTRDFGILRLMVNDPEKACEALKKEDCTVTITDVIVIGVEDKPGKLADILCLLHHNSISVEYMYAFISKTDNMAFVILRVEDNDKTIKILEENNIDVISNDAISKGLI